MQDAWIDQILTVMVLAPQHRFQVLTKRPERMALYLRDRALYRRILDCADHYRLSMPKLGDIAISNPTTHPAPWIWWGVSAEDQSTLVERSWVLRQTPAAVRFLSQEPTPRRDWPDPTQAMLDSPAFAAVWQCIKRWDINVLDVYTGYMGATGNHVRAILDALGGVTVPVELEQVDLRPDPQSVLVVRVPLHLIDEVTFARIIEDVQHLRPQGEEWQGLQIPVFVMPHDASIAQLDREKMRALGWVRVEEGETGDNATLL